MGRSFFYMDSAKSTASGNGTNQPTGSEKQGRIFENAALTGLNTLSREEQYFSIIIYC